MDSKLVAFRNYDSDAGFYFNETVEANIWDGDFVMTSGYWVIDDNYSYGSATGKDAMTQQIIVQGDAKVIIEDGCSLTMSYDSSMKYDAESLTKSITQTVSGAAEIAVGAINSATNKKKSAKSKQTETADSGKKSATVDKNGITALVSGIEGIIQSISSANEGTTVAMISVNSGNSFTLYGQEESTGKLEVEGTVKNSATAYNKGGAALGSDGNQDVGSITINGGQVIASSNTNAAAIGSGSDDDIDRDQAGACIGLTINGGDVTATIVYNGHGTENEGAAIGSCKQGLTNGITINGGHVTATGYHYGAGIGSGNGGRCYNITINGGSITALGGDCAAGIGTGYQPLAGSYGFTINNGYVHAEGGGKTASTGTQSGAGGAGIGAGKQDEPGTEEGEGDDKVITYFISQIYINGGYVYAVRGQRNVIKEYGKSGESGDHSWAIGRGDGNDTYPVNYVYVSGEMKLSTISVDTSSWTEVTTVVDHSSGTELAKGGADDSPLYQADKVECVTIRLTYGDIQDSYYEITAGKSNIGYYEGGVDGGGYIYVTDGMSVINSASVEFSNIYVNGDTAHGGVICADEEGGIINLVDVDFANNKVIHNYTEAAGGAIYSNGKYETTLVRCDFTNNMASGYRLESFGGAIAVTGEALLTIKDATFKNNKATTQGGSVWNNHSFVITGSDFINGYADKGGAVYAAAGGSLEDSKRILDSTFAYNTANFGGALYVEVGSAVYIENSEFINNNAHSYNYDIESEYIDYGDHQGGAIYVDGNKDARMGGTVVITNTDFTGNYAKQGAGIYVDSYANVAIKYADFIDNFAEDEGGAIYVAQNGTLALDNVYFSGNTSYVSGLVEREKEVTRTDSTEDKSDDSETETTESSVTKYGTYNEEVILTQYCAVYNEGEINITGYVEVDPYSLDVLYNRGRVNWDMNGVTANGFFSDITLFSNEVTSGSYVGSFGITVNEDDIEGVSRYVIAEHAVFDKMSEDKALTLKRFVLHGVDGELDKVIIADGNTVEYNGKTYRLYTTDAEHYNQLILSVEGGETERNVHIVVDREHFNGAVLNTSGEFADFKNSETDGGAVLLTEGAVFSAHDSTFSGNEAKAGGAIYAVAGSKVNLTNVTFNGNTSADGASGAIYIAADATVVMHGDVVLSTTNDTITNYGTLVWSISLTDNGYLSDYSLLNNGKYGSLVIENAPKSTYGKYRLADNAKSADGAKFLLSDGQSESITVNSGDWVSCGNMEARVYVDENKKYSLWLEVRATRIDVALDTYTMQDDYVVDMTGSSAYEGDGGLIYVHSNGRLQNEGSVKITGTYATGDGGAVYSEGNVKLSHAKFIDNHSYGKGGAIYGKGIKITLTDSTFSGNASDEGGAIWNLGGKTILDNVTFNNNTAIGDGGAIYGGDIDLVGDVYLSSSKDTIWMEENKTLNWTIDGNDTGYISDFSLITGNVTAETFTIDAEDALVGHCYTLAGNAETADGQTFTITVTGEDGAEEHTMTVNGETLLVNDVSYILGLNDSNELTLSVNQHIVVDYTLLIDSVQDFSWAGMDTYTGNGSIFEITADGIMTNVFAEKSTFSYAASFKDGSVGKDGQGNGGNGGIIYNEGCLTLDSAYFEANTAEGNGGALYSRNCMYVTNASFYYNEAEYGGAVYVAGGVANYISGTFYGNTATEKGGAVYLAAGAGLTLSDTTFKGNEADEGGAIYNEGDILLTGELVLSSSDDSFINYGTVTLDYASNASIRGYQYLTNCDEGNVCISVAGLEAGKEIWQYEFAKGDFSGDYEYVDEFTLTDGTTHKTITVDGGLVEFNGLNYSIEINETGDALLLNAYAKKNISISLNDMTKKYDGLEMTCTDYTISGTLESVDDLVFTVSDSITDVGSKQVNVSSWKVLRDGVDVSHEYNLTSSGCTLTVTPRYVTLTSSSATKVYDGSALTCHEVTVSGDGFVAGEGAGYTYTGSQTEVGTSANTFSYTLNEGTNAENYRIAEETGVLSVGWINPKEIAIVVDNLSKMYDGSALEATYRYNSEVLAEGDELIVVLDHTDITNADKVDVSVVEYKVVRGTEDVTSGYIFAPVVSGSLEVTKRNISVTTGSAQKLYDGTALTDGTVNVTGDGFALGEGWTSKVTGSQTQVGTSDNTFEYEFYEGTTAGNYNVTVDPGKLKVYTLQEAIVITVDNLTKMYDGKTLDATYSYTPGVLKDGDELVVTLSTDSIIDVAESTAVTVTGYKVLRDGVDVTKEYAFANSVAGSLNVTQRNIQVATGSAQKLYDGTPLINNTVIISGDEFALGEGWNFGITGNQVEVGMSDNTFEYKFNQNTKAGNYNVTVDPGKLKVYTAEEVITITVDNLTKMYDGKALEATYSYTQGIIRKSDKLVVTLSTDSITDVAESTAVTVTGYKVLRNGADVTNEYAFADSVAGSLNVTQRNILVATGSAQKLYDGTALTYASVDVTGDGFVQGEGWTSKVTGSQTKVGTSDNTFEYTFNASTKAGNYNVTVDPGKLKVYTAVDEITITVDNLTKMYDGKALDATYSYTQGILKAGDELVVTLSTDSIIDVAESTAVTVTGYKVLRNGADVTNEYAFADSVAGSLNVTQRNIQVVTGSAQKLYDGTALTDGTVNVTGDGFAQGEGWTSEATGSQTQVGMSDNTFEYTFNANTKAGNYNVTVDPGKLKVYTAKDVITITVDDLTKMYDGKALDATYSYTQGIIKAGDELVVTLSTDSITDVAESTVVTVTDRKVMRNGADVTNEYVFADSVAGSLEITRRDVTLTSGTKAKTYDGVALSDTTIIVSGKDGYAEGEALSYYDFAELNKVGHCWNTFQYGSSETAKVGNYNVTVETGVLTVYDAADLYVKGLKGVNVDSEYTSIAIESDSTLLIEQTATVSADVIVYNGNNGIITTENPNLRCNELYVKGSNNKLNGFAAQIDQVTIAANTDLTVQMDQFDQLIASASFTEENKGTLNVLSSAGNALIEQSDIDAVIDEQNLLNVDFQMELFNVNKLTFDASQAKNIAFDDAFGTAKNDTIRFAQNSIVSLGRQGKSIDLAAGSNTVQIDKNAAVAINSDLKNVSKIQVANGAKRNGVQLYTELDLNNVSFAEDRSGSFKIGNYNEVNAGNITGGDKADQITVGKSEFNAAAIALGEGNDKLTLNSDAVATFDSLDFGDGNNTLKLGSDSHVEITGLLDFGADKDTLTLGKKASLSVDTLDVENLDKLSMSKDSELVIADFESWSAAQTKWEKYSAQIKLA